MADNKSKVKEKLSSDDPEDISMVKQETMDTLEEKLNAIGKSTTTPDDGPAEDMTETETDNKTDETAEKSTPARNVKEAVKEKESTTPEKSAAEDKPMQFPDAYRRALIHQEWTQEEIDDLVQTNPEKALAVGRKMYETTNRLSQQFAAAGRVQTGTSPIEKVVRTETPASEFKGIDRKKIIEAFDGDERAGALVDQFNEVLQRNNKQIETLNSQLKSAKTEPETVAATDPEVDREVKAFFGDSEFLKTYGDFYGREENILDNTGNQATRRAQLFDTADQIMAGSIMAGQEMTINEALNRAHLIVAKDQIETAIRGSIKKSLVKRSKSMTLVPSGTHTPDKPRTHAEKEAALEERVGKKLKEVYG